MTAAVRRRRWRGGAWILSTGGRGSEASLLSTAEELGGGRWIWVDGACRARLARTVTSLPDLWGRGFYLRGNDVVRAGIPPPRV